MVTFELDRIAPPYTDTQYATAPFNAVLYDGPGNGDIRISSSDNAAATSATGNLILSDRISHPELILRNACVILHREEGICPGSDAFGVM